MTSLSDLLSDDYRAQLLEMARDRRWAGTADGFAPEVLKLAGKVGAKTVLDYGAGPGSLARVLRHSTLEVIEFDPGYASKSTLPSVTDMVVCTDVLEHVEPEYLHGVLSHIYELTGIVAFMVVATRPAEKLLPDGRNAHLIVESGQWWFEQLARFNWQVHSRPVDVVGTAKFWVRKWVTETKS